MRIRVDSPAISNNQRNRSQEGKRGSDPETGPAPLAFTSREPRGSDPETGPAPLAGISYGLDTSVLITLRARCGVMKSARSSLRESEDCVLVCRNVF